jgi:hypothetical protein
VSELPHANSSSPYKACLLESKKTVDVIDLISKDPFNTIYEQLILESGQLSEKSRDKEMELSIICKGWQDID